MKLKILWHFGWYQGPYDGLGEIEDGTKVWFQRQIDDAQKEPEPFPELNMKNYTMEEIGQIFEQEEGGDEILEQLQQNLESLRKYHEDNIMKRVKPYFDIYSLDPFQLEQAEDYHKQYQEKIGFDRDHGTPYKPNHEGQSLVFQSTFDPEIMTIEKVGTVHIDDVIDLLPPTSIDLNE